MEMHNNKAENSLFIIFLILSSLVVVNARWGYAQEIVEPSASITLEEPALLEPGNQIKIVMQIQPGPPSPIFHGIFLNVTRPDGKTERISLQGSQHLGTIKCTYRLNTPGEYTFQLIYPGETFTDYNIVFQPAKSEILSITVPAVEWANDSGSWTTLRSMSKPRTSLGAAVVNGKIYAMGGYEASGDITSSRSSTRTTLDLNEEYDPQTNKWTKKASMPTAMFSFAIAAVQGNIHCIGNGVHDVYNPVSDTWTAKTPSPNPRDGAKATVVDDKIYLIGGTVSDDSIASRARASNLNEVYDPTTDSWSAKAPIPVGFWGSSCALTALDKKIYAIGALRDDDHNYNQIYDVQTDQWSYGASPPVLFYGWSGGGTAAATTGEMAPKLIYLMSSVTASNQVYNPKTDSWTIGKDLPIRRQNSAIAVVNDTLFVIGGNTFQFTYPDDTFGVFITVYSTNQQYTPIGYGEPDPTYQPPTPSPTPTPSPSLTPINTPTNIPTNSPSPSPSNSAAGQPTIVPTESKKPDVDPSTGYVPNNLPLLLSVIAIAIIVVAVGVLVYFKKHKNENNAQP
jgi:N-acetylneuraminic acid mutarotase